MDLTLLTGLIIALGGTAATVITALGAYKKAVASRTEERRLLTSVWDADREITSADVGRHLLDLLPARVRRRIDGIVNQHKDNDEEIDGAPNHSDA